MAILQKWLMFNYMQFIENIRDKKFKFLSILLFIYLILNFLDGERGLISYIEKQNIKKQLIQKEKSISSQLDLVVKRNELLTNKLDLDYLEILYRSKFMVGKDNEKIYIK